MVQDGGIGNSLIWVPTDEPPHMGGSMDRGINRLCPVLPGATLERPNFEAGQGLMMRNCTAREAAAEMVAQPSLKRAVFR